MRSHRTLIWERYIRAYLLRVVSGTHQLENDDYLVVDVSSALSYRVRLHYHHNALQAKNDQCGYIVITEGRI